LRRLKVPDVSIGRLAVYLRALGELDLKDPGRRYISSSELGALAGVSPTQVRKDLALFGEFGKQGVGYDALNLHRELEQILGCDRRINVAVAGAGELGIALVRHNVARRHEGGRYPFVMAAAFDVDPEKIGTVIAGVTPVYHSSEIPRRVREAAVKMGIIAVPPSEAQGVAELMVQGGIMAILNFAPARLALEPRVQVVQADVSLELVRLAYYLKG